MPSGNKSLAELSNEELAGLLAPVKGTDSVELKLTVPAAGHTATISALRLDPLEAQIRQVFFFDTPDLDLSRAGVVARARRIQSKAEDSVVKLRPVDPETLPDDLRLSPSMVVEVDAMPGGWVCSASLKGRPAAGSVREAAADRLPIRKLFTKEQRAFYAAHAPDGLELNGLSVLGPIFVLKVKFSPEELGRKAAAEMWLYPDGGRILELSLRCAPSEMFQVAAESRAFLGATGVDLAGDQQTKTRAVLDLFTAEYRAGAPA